MPIKSDTTTMTIIKSNTTALTKVLYGSTEVYSSGSTPDLADYFEVSGTGDIDSSTIFVELRRKQTLSGAAELHATGYVWDESDNEEQVDYEISIPGGAANTTWTFEYYCRHLPEPVAAYELNLEISKSGYTTVNLSAEW